MLRLRFETLTNKLYSLQDLTMCCVGVKNAKYAFCKHYTRHHERLESYLMLSVRIFQDTDSEWINKFWNSENIILYPPNEEVMFRRVFRHHLVYTCMCFSNNFDISWQQRTFKGQRTVFQNIIDGILFEILLISRYMNLLKKYS